MHYREIAFHEHISLMWLANHPPDFMDKLTGLPLLSKLIVNALKVVALHFSLYYPTQSQFENFLDIKFQAQLGGGNPPKRAAAAGRTVHEQASTMTYQAVIELSPYDAKAPRFAGRDITEFLEEYDFVCDRAQWDEQDRKRMVPYFTERLQQRFIRQLGGYRDERVSWEDFKTTLKRDFKLEDKAQRRGT